MSLISQCTFYLLILLIKLHHFSLNEGCTYINPVLSSAVVPFRVFIHIVNNGCLSEDNVAESADLWWINLMYTLCFQNNGRVYVLEKPLCNSKIAGARPQLIRKDVGQGKWCFLSHTFTLQESLLLSGVFVLQDCSKYCTFSGQERI